MILRLFRQREPAWLLRAFPPLFYLWCLLRTASPLFPEPQLRYLAEFSNLPAWFSHFYFSWVAGAPALWIFRFCLVGAAFPIFSGLFRVAVFAFMAVYGAAMAGFPNTGADRFFLFPLCALCLCTTIRRESRASIWGLEMIRYQFLMVFGAAGISKLIHPGSRWFETGYVQDLIYSERAAWYLQGQPAAWITHFKVPPELFTLLGAAMVVVEVFCLVAALYRPSRRAAILSVVALWMGQYLLIGWFFYEFLPFLLLFVPYFLKSEKNYAASERAIGTIAQPAQENSL